MAPTIYTARAFVTHGITGLEIENPYAEGIVEIIDLLKRVNGFNGHADEEVLLYCNGEVAAVIGIDSVAEVLFEIQDTPWPELWFADNVVA